jgi:hypothetical protein
MASELLSETQPCGDTPTPAARGSQYHLPRAKPPKARRPTKTMINPIQKLQTIIRTIPMMTMIPPVDIPAIPPRFSLYEVLGRV